MARQKKNAEKTWQILTIFAQNLSDVCMMKSKN